MIAQIVVFSRKTDAQRKKNFAFRSAKIAKSFANGNPNFTKYFSIFNPKNIRDNRKKININ